MPDKVADHVLGRVWRELAGAYAPGSLRESASLFWRPGASFLIRSPDGTVVELTARTVPAGDPAVDRIERSIDAIDRGEVE